MTETERNSIGILDFITYFLLCIYSFMDCLTGFCAIYGMPSPGSAYKFLLILIFAVSIGVRNNKKILLPIYLFIVILIAYFFNLFINTNFSNANDSVAMVLRIILCPILFLYLDLTYKNERIL